MHTQDMDDDVFSFFGQLTVHLGGHVLAEFERDDVMGAAIKKSKVIRGFHV